MSLLIHDVLVGGRRVDVRVVDGHVDEVAFGLRPDARVQQTFDGAGGALLPGLHDHHIHLLALAAAGKSVDVGPCAVDGLDALAEALRAATPRHGWIRATGYHESVAGPLDRYVLDRLVPQVPVRVQHRSGALWILNSAALKVVAAVLDASADVERDDDGAPTGRLWRYDSRLRPALPAHPPDLAPVGRRLAAYGITGVTDATPALTADSVALLAAAQATGALPQRLTVLGAPTPVGLPPGIAPGPRKLLLRDHDLPGYDQLVAMVASAHDATQAVAVHCVTRESLVLTLAVLEEVGVRPGDRIEHASVAPPEVAAWMARLGVRVVTQPDFLRTRGSAYARDVAADDLPHLYPYASLLDAGVPTCASSDAPYGEVDPWRVIASAADRALGPEERVSAHVALRGYLSAADDPGGPPRRVRAGVPADLVLLGSDLVEAMRSPEACRPVATWIRGIHIT
ncbi:amidohydrolase family protein [Streptomyces sp. NPDC021080]|uniref:amidohydrolase family protein n=1 Tax=Streptomyces sp. NPDC021080 TaxID=3365110 RepID=UPI0037A57C60